MLPRYLVRQVQASLQDFSEHTPILVYQMGKVGSMAVLRTLREEVPSLSNPVYHVHVLSPENVQRAERERIRRGQMNDSGSRHVRVSKVLQKRVDELTRRCLIITGVREPISRTVSAVFQNMHRLYPELLDEEGRVKKATALELLQRKIHNFGRRSFPGYHWFDSVDFACNWFDEELKQVFGVDIYEVPFDHGKGYVAFRQGDIRVLVLRQESMKQGLTLKCDRLLPGVFPLKLQLANAAAQKNYASVYRSVKEKLTLPESVCQRIYSTRYVQHFYGEEMISEFLRRWTSGPVSAEA